MTTWTDHLLARSPGGPAVMTEGRTWSTAELLARAGGASDWLDEIDAARHTPVPAVLRSSPEAITLIIAGALSNRPVAPLGPQLAVSDLVSCLEALGADILVTDESDADVAAEAAAAAGLRMVVLPSAFPAGTLPPSGSPGPDDIVAILHTSGTSGSPKRVPMQQGRMATRAMITGHLMQLGPGDRYVTAKGLHHVGGLGLTLVALARGAAVLPMRRFSVAAWQALASLGPTHASTVPAMVEMLLEAGAVRMPTMRCLQYGGAPMFAETLAAIVALEPDLDLVGFYGQTEGSPIACLTPQDHRRAVAGRPDLLESAGRLVSGVQLEIHAPTANGDGELWVRADHFFGPGSDGWVHTGDIGRLDDEDYLCLSGRIDDMIIRGGENVHPVEVERAMATHPGVAAIAVAALPDRRLGETVGAWVVPSDPANPPTDDELRRHARTLLAGIKVPAVWIHIDELPVNANGKVVRRLLRRPELHH